jgi:biotin carboxyl carrier protein
VRFQVQAAGRTRVVDVQREGRTYRVTVDGRPHVVDLARAGRAWSLLIGPAEAGPHDGLVEAAPHDGPADVGAGFSRPVRSYEIFFAEHPGGTMTVHVNGHPVAVAQGGAGRRHQEGASTASSEGPQRVVAPMAGRVIRVLVKKDDVVAARQPLVVVEAMKMENELRSPRAGVVAEVKVSEGTSVDANTVLVVVD